MSRFYIEIEYIACKLSKGVKPINIDYQTLRKIFFPVKSVHNLNMLQWSTNLKLDIIQDFRNELSDIYRNVEYDTIMLNLIKNKKNLPYICLKLYQHNFIDANPCRFTNVGYTKYCVKDRVIGSNKYYETYYTN